MVTLIVDPQGCGGRTFKVSTCHRAGVCQRCWGVGGNFKRKVGEELLEGIEGQ